MISRIGMAISRAFERTAPDPLVLAIALTFLTGALALAFGVFPEEKPDVGARIAFLLDSWRDNTSGMWKLLSFSMQMCLILVTGHALATTRPVAALIDRIAGVPASTASAAAMVAFVACAAGLVNWGLGLIVGALLAREVGRSMHMRGLRCHYPLIVAAGYAAMLVWHGGLSGSAPLSMSTATGAGRVLPERLVQQFPDGVPLTQTLLSPMNIFISAGLLLVVPAVFALLAPRRDDEVRSCESFAASLIHPRDDADEAQAVARSQRSLPDMLERSPIVAWLLAALLIAAMIRFAGSASLSTIGLNEVNAAMLALGLILHGSPRSYMRAAEDGARGCAGIIIQFPLYAGIMAMMESSGLVVKVAQAFNAWGSERTIPLLSFLSAGVVNLFVPSGGGQWALQGPIALQAGTDAGISPGKMVMSVAYGDQLTNMLQPFWALPLLAITKVRARDIVGYTAIVMIVAAAWIMLGLLLW